MVPHDPYRSTGEFLKIGSLNKKIETYFALAAAGEANTVINSHMLTFLSKHKTNLQHKKNLELFIRTLADKIRDSDNPYHVSNIIRNAADALHGHLFSNMDEFGTHPELAEPRKAFGEAVLRLAEKPGGSYLRDLMISAHPLPYVRQSMPAIKKARWWHIGKRDEIVKGVAKRRDLTELAKEFINNESSDAMQRKLNNTGMSNSAVRDYVRAR